MNITDPIFLWLYFFNIVLHVSDYERCERSRKHLTQQMLLTSQSAQIAQMVCQVINPAVLLYNRCMSFNILGSWTTFLKSLVRNAPGPMGEAVTLLLCGLEISAGSIFPEVVEMIIDVAQGFIENSDTNLTFAGTNGWHISLIKFLIQWYRIHSAITTLDFSCIFVLLTKFVPFFTRSVIAELQKLSGFVTQSRSHTKAFHVLLQAIYDR
jgi:hypothetical protein